eukprot:CAMPEP_0197892798 /NCGR_PEP_ID=MMETSP1439-20131203/31646_1 /TAXON_ID=66791 /ORGANISM="Gonyaulax spinifera, Strain CCMP409" /LENGTH=31 /DNA_ID= /DNA_START= /DNA_END= /DNA_ORIENTATION=
MLSVLDGGSVPEAGAFSIANGEAAITDAAAE